MKLVELKQVLERNGYILTTTGVYRDHKLVYQLFHNGTCAGLYTKRQIEYELFGALLDEEE